MTDGPLLRFDGITLRFFGVTALREVSFEIAHGELLAVIGPNGAGKTTIFNCINGVYHPQEGRMELHGRELRGGPVEIARQGVARTFQNLGLFSNLTVLDNLMLGRHLRMRTGFLAGALWLGPARREEAEHRARVEEVVELLELEQHRHVPVSVLPYGIKKRIELGRALAMEPELLLLDEPVAGMSLEEAQDMARYLVEVRRRLGTTMILVEHDMAFVMDLADRVLVLDFGEVIAEGDPEHVQHDQRVIDAYLGSAA
jgi:branched-chain amino acid transport system ATP-binding protein